MKPEVREGTAYNYRVEQFLKCPECHRSSTVKLVHHPSGDFIIRCVACDAGAGAAHLLEQDRVHQ
jgi:hypothetical protein